MPQPTSLVSPHAHDAHFVFITEQASYGVEYSFGQFGSIILAVLPPKILPISRLLVRGSIGETVLLLSQCCSAKALAVINTFLATDGKHSTVRAAMGKSNSIHSQTQHTVLVSKRGEILGVVISPC